VQVFDLRKRLFLGVGASTLPGRTESAAHEFDGIAAEELPRCHVGLVCSVWRLISRTLEWADAPSGVQGIGDRWSCILIVAHARFRLARPLTGDLRRPWEKPAAPDRFTCADVG
jgi:hypothetical protein